MMLVLAIQLHLRNLMDAGVDVRGNRRLHQESGKEENAPQQQQRWGSHLWIVSKTHRRPQITLDWICRLRIITPGFSGSLNGETRFEAGARVD